MADFCYFKLRNLGKGGKCVSERNTRTEGEDFSNTSSVNCGLQRKDSSGKVVSGCSNTIIGKGEFLNTSSVDLGGPP